jgi:hypothetical protein
MLGLSQIFFSGLEGLRAGRDECGNCDQAEYGQEPSIEACHVACDCAGSLADAGTQCQKKRDPRGAAQLLAWPRHGIRFSKGLIRRHSLLLRHSIKSKQCGPALI